MVRQKRKKFLKPNDRKVFISKNLILTGKAGVAAMLPPALNIYLAVDFIYNILTTFELLLHARRGLWSPSSMQELSSFHLVDPNCGRVMMIVVSDM